MCAKKADTNVEYSDALCRLLELCGLGFLKERSSDESAYSPQVIEVLSTLGHLVCGESDKVRAEVSKTVARLFSSEYHSEGETEGTQKCWYMYTVCC